MLTKLSKQNPKITTIIFDVDGVLIEADNDIRIKKYEKLFRDGLDLVKSPDYNGSKWLFDILKNNYDVGVRIDPEHYQLTEKDLEVTLARLATKYDLYVTSWADEEITMDKLKATRINGFFKGYVPGEKLDKLISVYPDAAIVDDRPKKFSPNLFFIKLDYGQYAGQECGANWRIEKVSDLL